VRNARPALGAIDALPAEGAVATLRETGSWLPASRKVAPMPRRRAGRQLWGNVDFM
jgi:hypothetical protein